MNDRQARETTLLEAYEQPGAANPSWTDDDRRWVDRVALEATAEGTPVDGFVAERARHAMQRLLPRDRAAARWLDRRDRFGVWLALAAFAAFVLGVWPDPFAGSQRVNLLAPPLWGVLAWNVVVYVVLAVAALGALLGLRRSRPGALRRAAERLLGAGGDERAAGAAAMNAAAAASSTRDMASSAAVPAVAAPPLARALWLWQQRRSRVSARRAATLLHVAAAALGAGLIAGIYLRGLAFDYRVGWESTFLSPVAVHTVLSTALAPAARLAGAALPDEAAVAALRLEPSSSGAGAAGAPAAIFLHLLALTVAGVVVLPRFVLALAGAAQLRFRRSRFALPLDSPYYERLSRLQRGAGAEVVVVPYAQTPSPQAALALRSLITEAFGPKANVRIAPTASFGAGDDDAPASPDGDGDASALAGATHVILLCDLAATPEPESHGRYAGRLATRLPQATPAALVIDEASFKRQFAGIGERLAQRRAAWRLLAERIGAEPAFIDLAGGVDAANATQLQAAFGRGLRASAERIDARP